MALLTTGEFYEVVFKPMSDPAWSSMLPSMTPDIPAAIAVAMIAAAPKLIYVVDSSSGSFAFPGGVVYQNWTDSLISGAPTPLPRKVTTVNDAGHSTVSVLDSSDKWYQYSPSAGTLIGVPLLQKEALRDFLIDAS